MLNGISFFFFIGNITKCVILKDSFMEFKRQNMNSQNEQIEHKGVEYI